MQVYVLRRLLQEACARGDPNAEAMIYCLKKSAEIQAQAYSFRLHLERNFATEPADAILQAFEKFESKVDNPATLLAQISNPNGVVRLLAQQRHRSRES